jgi:type VI secretion system lysozyme-like protein
MTYPPDDLALFPGVPSIVERLAAGYNPPDAHIIDEKQLLDSVRRNLEWVFNAKRPHTVLTDTYASLRESLYYYGLPDLLMVSVKSEKDRRKLLDEIQSTVRLFERRLDRAKVLPLEPNPHPHKLSFRVEGRLLMLPQPAQIGLDWDLDLANQEFRLKERQ